MQPNDHLPQHNLEAAAHWYAANRDNLRSAFIPELRRRFGLTPLQAIEAGQRAHRIYEAEKCKA